MQVLQQATIREVKDADDVKKPEGKKQEEILSWQEQLSKKEWEQELKQKQDVLAFLKLVFTVQIAILTFFVFLQGIKYTPDLPKFGIPLGFELDNTLLEIYTGATILQIAAMLLVAVKHLFPESNK